MTLDAVIASLSSSGLLKGYWGSAKDTRYEPLSVDFVREALREWVNSLPPELRTTRDIGGGKTVATVRWVEEVGDCDNIAWDFCTFLSRCVWVDAVKHNRSRGNAAAGLLFFLRAIGDGHAIVWFTSPDGKVHLVDPASQEFDHLTEADLAGVIGGDYA